MSFLWVAMVKQPPKKTALPFGWFQTPAVKKEEGEQAVGGGGGSCSGAGDAPRKKVGNFEVESDGSLRIPQNYEYVVDKKFIDEMFSLVKVGEDGKK